MFFKDGGFDGKECSEQYKALCEKSVTSCPGKVVKKQGRVVKVNVKVKGRERGERAKVRELIITCRNL